MKGRFFSTLWNIYTFWPNCWCCSSVLPHVSRAYIEVNWHKMSFRVYVCLVFAQPPNVAWCLTLIRLWQSTVSAERRALDLCFPPVLSWTVSRAVNVWPGEEVGLRGVGGGGLEGLGGRRGLEPPDDTEGDPVLFADLRPLGEDLCSTLSTAGELSRLRLWRGKVEG